MFIEGRENRFANELCAVDQGILMLNIICMNIFMVLNFRGFVRSVKLF